VLSLLGVLGFSCKFQSLSTYTDKNFVLSSSRVGLRVQGLGLGIRVESLGFRV